MLELMNTPDDVVNYALIYMRVYFLGTIGNLIYNMGSGILRAVGDSKRPLLYLIICCMTNIVLDFLFVVGMQMGVMGAALATILSQIISAVLVMGSLMRTRDIYRLHLRKISIDWIMLKRIIRIGFPAGVQSILYSVSNVIIQSAVNSLGTNNVAAWAAYGKVDGLFLMFQPLKLVRMIADSKIWSKRLNALDSRTTRFSFSSLSSLCCLYQLMFCLKQASLLTRFLSSIPV